MKKKARLKIIPDRIFHKLWDSAATMSFTDFLHNFTYSLSADYIDFYRRFDIEPLAASSMLSNIHHRANQSFKEIIEEAQLKKAEVYHCFCVPKRTMDDWYSGANRCPSYFRLALLKQYHMLNLGKYIILESEKKYRSTFPPVYEKNEPETNTSDDIYTKSPDLPAAPANRLTYAQVERMLAKGNPKDVMDSEAISQLLGQTEYLMRNRKKDS